MHFRGRPTVGRPPILASALAALLAFAATGTVAAGTSAQPAVPDSARIQRPGDVGGYRLPFAAGLKVYIHQGWNSTYSHNGRSAFAYDFGLYLNTPVLAAASGVVSYVHSGETACGGAELRNHANYVTIDHPDGSSTQYGHLGKVEVAVGDVVEVGQEIALSGRTGYTGCMPHLHFARQLQGGAVTQSIPVYFDEFPEGPLRHGQTVETTETCGPKAVAPLGAFCATYRSVADDAPALFSRIEEAIDFDWAKHGPGGYWLDNADGGFAATWTGRFKIKHAGVYGLAIRATDRVRVTIDGVVLVNAWTDHPRTRKLSIAWRATPGKHEITIEHVDLDGHGRLKVSWRADLLDGAWVRWAQPKPEA